MTLLSYLYDIVIIIIDELHNRELKMKGYRTSAGAPVLPFIFYSKI